MIRGQAEIRILEVGRALAAGRMRPLGQRVGVTHERSHSLGSQKSGNLRRAIPFHLSLDRGYHRVPRGRSRMEDRISIVVYQSPNLHGFHHAPVATPSMRVERVPHDTAHGTSLSSADVPCCAGW
jgi:hypothetical protein